jgi:hypothetical protein
MTEYSARDHSVAGELNKVGDGKVQTVGRKGLNNGGERWDISLYGKTRTVGTVIAHPM